LGILALPNGAKRTGAETEGTKRGSERGKQPEKEENDTIESPYGFKTIITYTGNDEPIHTRHPLQTI
jgi:hypothetical protein